MFLGIVDTSAKRLCNALEERKNKLDHYHDAVLKLPDNNDKNIMELYHLLIQAALFSDKGISTKELEETLKISYNTVKRRLETISPNFIIKKYYKKQNYYMIDLEEIDNYLR